MQLAQAPQVTASSPPRPVLGSYFTRGIRFRTLADLIERQGSTKMLVMGCGNGYLESILPPTVQGVSVDMDTDALAIARGLNTGRTGWEWHEKDIFQVFDVARPGTFDGVVVAEVVEHLRDDRGVLRLAREALEPGGTLFLTVPNRVRFQNRVRMVLGRTPHPMSDDHLREYSLGSAARLLREAGFTVRETVGLDFWLPKDQIVRRVLPQGHASRRWAGRRWPRLATWLLFVADRT